MLGFFRRLINSRYGVVITLGFLAVIALAFAAGDITGIAGQGGVLGSSVIKVDGEGVSATDLRRSVEQQMRAVRREQPEERTRVRANGPMRQPTGVTVPAVWCPAGHFSPPDAPYCRTCGQPVPPQQPMRVPRPPLGTLHLPEGHRVLLDRPVVLGRRPQPVPDSDPWPHLVELPGELTHLSRNHLAVELDGWHVLARDLGSSGGTALHAPGRAPIRLRPHDPHVLEPGQSLVLSGDFTVVFVAATT